MSKNSKNAVFRELCRTFVSLLFVSNHHFTFAEFEHFYHNFYLNEFAVCLISNSNASEVAERSGFKLKHQIFDDCSLFEHRTVSKLSLDYSHYHHSMLMQNDEILWVEQQSVKRRTKREVKSDKFKDPFFKDQWYINNGAYDGSDMNVAEAWKSGFSGKGVVVTILDDGIQHDHPDLATNYDAQASYDINGNDPDPYPRDDGYHKHGTRCAGEVAATANNEFCGVGIAFNSRIGGVRMLDGKLSDEVEARALGFNPDLIDIYIASWGPKDDGATLDGPGVLASRALLNGIKEGRSGLGSIYVWASGNGGLLNDNCNCDGYTNSIYTLSISSATQAGLKPWYLEECSSTLASTYSSGAPGKDKSIVTIDMDTSYFHSLKVNYSITEYLCTKEHVGTSASASIASGIVALALEANPQLSWRDVQHIAVLSSRYEPLKKEEGWSVNGIKKMFSHKFGYGLIDAAKMVKLAKKWKNVAQQRICEMPAELGGRQIPGDSRKQLEVFIHTDACNGTSNEIRYLEHVQARLTLSFFPRGKLKITLISPSNTSSHLLFPRPQDNRERQFNNWPFLSVHFWSENPKGTWKLIIKNGNITTPASGILSNWRLVFYGTYENPSTSYNNSHHLSRETFETKSSANFCKEINKFKSSKSGECQNSCPDGEFGDYETGVCKSCSSECATCYGPSSDNCLSCKHNFYYRDLCVDNCPDGTYADSKLNVCLPCLSTCKTCVKNATTCTSCKEGFIVNVRSKCEKSDKTSTLNETCLTCSASVNVIMITCLSSILLFIVVFVVLQIISSTFNNNNLNRYYKDYKKLSSKFDDGQETVLLTCGDVEEEC